MDKTVEPITDDAELAKVLEGMQDASLPAAPAAPAPGDLTFEETAQVPTADAATPPAPIDPPAAVPADPALSIPEPSLTSVSSTADPALESIKKDALTELRPLVDKLDLPADEKFDTLLLIIRSTDDKTLVQSAYDSAKLITDDAKRAEALLDIVKEIDYFNQAK